MIEEPIPPGRVLFEQFMKAQQLSINRLAKSIRVPANRLSEIIRGRRAITADTAIRLAKFFGNPIEFWLNLQQSYDLYRAQCDMNDASQISPFDFPAMFPDIPDDPNDLFEFSLRRVGHLRFRLHDKKAGITLLRESGFNVLYWTAWDEFDDAVIAYQMTMLRLPNSASELRWQVRQWHLQGYKKTSVTPNLQFLLDEIKAAKQ